MSSIVIVMLIDTLLEEPPTMLSLEDLDILCEASKSNLFFSLMFCSPCLDTLINHCIVSGFRNEKFMKDIAPVVEKHEKLKRLYTDYVNRNKDIGERVRYLMGMGP